MAKTDAVADIVSVLDLGGRMGPDQARVAGFVPVDELAAVLMENTGLTRQVVTLMVKSKVDEGVLERMKIGKQYWYKRA